MVQSKAKAMPTILVVDDEEIIRSIVVRMLLLKGYSVRVAVDGQEAAELLHRERGSMTLLLTDLTLPRKNGVELIREVKQKYPSLPVLVMSGNLLVWKQNENLCGIPCLAKPFTIDLLLNEVEKHVCGAQSKPSVRMAGSTS